MTNGILQLSPTINYMNTRNLNKVTSVSAKNIFLKNIYNGYEVKNMTGITASYNFLTHNGALSKEQLVNLDRLSEISKLSRNWDGHNSAQINSTVIENARTFIKKIYKQPVVFPTGRNSIQMQYELTDNSYLEFEIFGNKVLCMKVPKRVYANATFEKFDNLQMERANEIVKEFYGEENTEK